jgi:hypothetical protein
MKASLYIALMHYPVYSKEKTVITTSITPMDLHDISRSCLTFGVKKYFVINPMQTMQYLAKRMKGFWESDYGKNYNQTRTDAFYTMDIYYHLEECVDEIFEKENQKPLLVATSAKPNPDSIRFDWLSDHLHNNDQPVLMLLGTGYGIIQEMVRRCDYVLEPIDGLGDYNHLSVRSAAAIMLDRLCNPR